MGDKKSSGPTNPRPDSGSKPIKFRGDGGGAPEPKYTIPCPPKPPKK